TFAIKIIRTYLNSDMVQLAKVSPKPQSSRALLNFNHDHLQAFSHEAVTWAHLRHPNVLPFCGLFCPTSSVRFGFVSPWMDNGTVVDYLVHHPDADRRALVCNKLCPMCLPVNCAPYSFWMFRMGYTTFTRDHHLSSTVI